MLPLRVAEFLERQREKKHAGCSCGTNRNLVYNKKALFLNQTNNWGFSFAMALVLNKFNTLTHKVYGDFSTA
jgi:hypothetical protein